MSNKKVLKSSPAKAINYAMKNVINANNSKTNHSTTPINMKEEVKRASQSTNSKNQQIGNFFGAHFLSDLANGSEQKIQNDLKENKKPTIKRVINAFSWFLKEQTAILKSEAQMQCAMDEWLI
jgi:hypothetical protein